MSIFDELQFPLPTSWIGRTRWIIYVKLKLNQHVVTPVESHMLIDGRTDGRHAPYHNTTDFRRAYKETLNAIS